jgi:hypothetical protein
LLMVLAFAGDSTMTTFILFVSGKNGHEIESHGFKYSHPAI